MAVFAVLFAGCAYKTTDEHSMEHGAGDLKPIAYTLYSDKTELFVEFKPLVVNSKTTFDTHLTMLGEQFLPLTKGKVTVSLIVGENGIRQSSDTPSSPGLYRLALIPKTAGKGKLVYEIETENTTDHIIIENITVYADVLSALDNQIETFVSDEIVYLKEQAWQVEFANAPVVKTAFSDIIKTSGQILSAPGDEMVVVASASVILPDSPTNG